MTINFRVVEPNCAFVIDIDIRVIDREVFRQLERVLVDAFGYRRGRGTAVAHVILDTEVRIQPAGIVTGGKHEAAERVAAANHCRHGGRRE